ncbi:tRNA (adenosine(37)-N6)-threonylcarbamoyltransferase complex transferase subunit TsaD [Candidatus Woesebacteria bacterium RIFOXYD1_FULL_41_28]|uniref:tRNA N6-adenosine threonylcarbamoyltransferase n=2 Tax=Candidatus Woeseibacteriota TaxID=1752722 RepID=A0A0G0T3S9_9BACT|nr:MAG: putative tRNA threonylcarbamoyladenosine biosynthesis protein Gcp [Candidatus Woesebacteria bacterium GW2011_GWB1_40_12]OGM87104.1 MAG: tRNA (adenosine(37)-N6)-threonylcarbamoyltransferase complex transferase subunit TsaD [Candidatus Woesebacteria bacterium RIFOXYD1_FULL_41_28]
MKILAIDTSCDETSAAVTDGIKVLSNTIWSQATAHAKFGGVMPSLAKRMHEERIDWVIQKALTSAKTNIQNIDAVAVTIGPGLSIALGVGIAMAKELAIKHNIKMIAINHLEGHLLSPIADIERPLSALRFPAIGLVISGGNTMLVKIIKIGTYEVVAQTTDDALGEALDKAARMIGLGYPGGAVLEKIAKGGDLKAYTLPVPISGQEKRQIFTYSGLKTAYSRLVEAEKPLNKMKIQNLAACFQDVAFRHLTRVLEYYLSHSQFKIKNIFVGGGVSANIEIRKRLRRLCDVHSVEVFFPKSKKLYGDNAAMIGVAAYFKAKAGQFQNPNSMDRDPRAKLSN